MHTCPSPSGPRPRPPGPAQDPPPLAAGPAPHSLFHAHVNVALVVGVEPALHEQRPLDAEGRQQEVEAHRAVTVALQESHEEAEAHEDHHVHILEACGESAARGLGGLARSSPVAGPGPPARHRAWCLPGHWALR